jgi:AraC-like DNA-binding protein
MTDANNIPLHNFRFPSKEALPFEIIYIPDSVGIRKVDFTRPNRPNFYEIMWIIDAAGTRTIDFKAHNLQSNTLFFLTPGQVHYWETSQQTSVDGYAILFPEEFLQLGALDSNFLSNLDFFHRIDHDPVIYLDETQAPLFQNLVDSMYTEFHGDQPGRPQMLQSLLQIFLIQAQRHYQAGTPPAPSAEIQVIDQFRRLIDQHYLTTRSVQEYADLLGITAGYLTKISKDVSGLPAGNLIRDRLVMEAKRLLVHTDNTVAEICAELQFDDPSYFGRFFKRETGVSPLTFRQSYREKYQIPPN